MLYVNLVTYLVAGISCKVIAAGSVGYQHGKVLISFKFLANINLVLYSFTASANQIFAGIVEIYQTTEYLQCYLKTSVFCLMTVIIFDLGLPKIEPLCDLALPQSLG